MSRYVIGDNHLLDTLTGNYLYCGYYIKLVTNCPSDTKIILEWPETHPVTFHDIAKLPITINDLYQKKFLREVVADLVSQFVR